MTMPMGQLPEFDQAPGEILQQQDEPAELMPTLPVVVEGTARTQEVPARSGPCYTAEVGTTAEKILGRDPRRKSATIIAISQDVRIGTTQASAQSGARIPAVVPFVLGAMDEYWAAAVTGTTDISIITEQWAD